MNAERIAPDRIASRNGEYPISGRRQGWSTVPPSTLPASMVSPMTPSMEVPPSEVPLQEDIYSLLREMGAVSAHTVIFVKNIVDCAIFYPSFSCSMISVSFLRR